MTEHDGHPDLNTVSRLRKKYGNAYAMYVEYPHKSAWTSGFSGSDLETAVKKLVVDCGNPPVLLYVHIPFCPRQCFYCSCSTAITTDYTQILDYLRCLYLEIAMIKEAYSKAGGAPNISEIHIGGGSPTILRQPEFDQLLAVLSTICRIDTLSEFAIELDPRVTSMDLLRYYHSRGITRISFGVQEFDHAVQVAINRVQPAELLENIMVPETRSYFKGINFDIMWGLPRQTESSFAKTIETVARLCPDRISLLMLHYAPEVKKHQRLMKESELPSEEEKLRIIVKAADILQKNGYSRIGFDHFARHDDDLTKSLQKKNLIWNPLGYRPGRCVDMIGVGLSSSSRITGEYYFQNVYGVDEYKEAISAGRMAISRGCHLNNDDIIRRDVIQRIRTYYSCSPRDIEAKYQIHFSDYFRQELNALKRLEADGLVRISEAIDVTDIGKFFTFHICRVFDNRHMQP